MKVISISGGRSSAMMLKIMQDNNQVGRETIVCFANTGKESEATLFFVEQCARRWEIPVVWLEYTPDKPYFKVVNFETASRNGEPFEALINKRRRLPNPTLRFCTGDLKVKTIRRYVRSLGHRGHFDTYIGLRYDEPSRVALKRAQNDKGKEPEYYRMPLYDMRVTRKERDAFWSMQNFGLAIDSHHDNCDLCFMKGTYKIIAAIRRDPSTALWWIEQERKVSASAPRRQNARFHRYSYAELLDIATNHPEIDFKYESVQSLTCACTD